MTDASWPVQATVHSLLAADAQLAAMVTGVYDAVPEEATFPYVTIGDDTAVDFSTKTEHGQQITLTLHAWSRRQGRSEVKQILARLYELLHEQTLAVGGHANVLTRFEFTQTFRDPDGLTQHGVARYRLLVQDA